MVKVKIICRLHGEFMQWPSGHIGGNGCQACSGKKVPTTAEFIKQAIKIHGNLYDYSESVYVNNYTPIVIKCKKHGIFKPAPSNHIHNKTGCPDCNLSKGEIKIKNILENLKINYKMQHKFTDCKGDKLQLKFDFYLPDINSCIEYDGEQHFTPVAFNGHFTNKTVKKFNRVKRYDEIKNKYCNQYKISLLRIKYNDINEEEKIKLFINNCQI